MKTTSSIKDIKTILARKKYSHSTESKNTPLPIRYHFRKLPFDFNLFAMGTKLFFTDDSQTLEQCGLVPNATLGIQEIKQSNVKK